MEYGNFLRAINSYFSTKRNLATLISCVDGNENIRVDINMCSLRNTGHSRPRVLTKVKIQYMRLLASANVKMLLLLKGIWHPYYKVLSGCDCL